MPISSPYFRIGRPFTSGEWTQALDNNYVSDNRYAPDRIDLIRAYHLLEQELSRIFDYVEPADANVLCYSHQIYSLLLRASTEFETNARAILAANGYSKSGNWNINDFFKLNEAARLSEYYVSVPIWRGQRGRFKPYSNWANNQSLRWYQGYNSSKHDRFNNFASASLENAMTAVGAVFCVLFSQFNMFAFNPYHPPSMFELSDTGVWSHESCMLEIEPPTTFTEAERYDFDWGTLKTQSNPFQAFTF